MDTNNRRVSGRRRPLQKASSCEPVTSGTEKSQQTSSEHCCPWNALETELVRATAPSPEPFGALAFSSIRSFSI